MKVMITGGCGFLGSNLASYCMQQGFALLIFDSMFRQGAESNLNWLKSQGDFQFIQADTKDSERLTQAVSEFKPDVIFHLAGQVAMTTSIENPRRDFETNVLGGFNLLEAVRLKSPNSIIVYSSTNKVFGDLEGSGFEETETRYTCPSYPKGFPETITLDFQSPYGCSKGATDQYMLDYARLFGVRTVVFRHSTIFGGRQFATFDQGWVGWFVGLAVKAKKDQLAIDRLKNVQSTLLQSPLPLKIIGITRCRGKVSIIP
jgi:CDP-paratose 2-epimerase